MRCLTFAFIVVAASASAQENRELAAHEHGVGALDIAVEGNEVTMALRVPGADIVGFEYAAKTDEDRAAIEAGLATLSRPLDLFVLPAAAECAVIEVAAELEAEEGHEEHAVHDNDAHAHDDHGDEDHAHGEEASEEHGHEDQAHGDEDHASEAHTEEEHAHDDHAEGAAHTEFHAEYRLTCGDAGALAEIDFDYFDAFENAREVEVQIVSGSGAQAFEVTRDAPVLDLRGLF